MSTFQLFAATPKDATPLFAEFCGMDEQGLRSHFDRAAGFSAFELLLRVLDWWSTTGLAVYASPEEAKRTLLWIRDRLKASGKVAPPLPWRVGEPPPGKPKVLCSWNLSTATPDSIWVGRPGPRVLVRGDRSNTVLQDLTILQAIARDMGGSLVVIDNYATDSPGNLVLDSLAAESAKRQGPLISVGCVPGVSYPSTGQLPHLRFLTPSRVGGAASEFHDRFVAVLAQRHEASIRCEELVTALFLGHGLATAAPRAVKVASYGRIFGPPLEQLRGALAARYPLSSAA